MIEVIDKAIEIAKQKISEIQTVPSVSLISKCLRMTYYTKMEKTISEALILGLDYHDFYARKIADAMSELGWTCTTEKQVTYSTDIRIDGRIDVYCASQLGSMVIELKFTSNPTAHNVFLQFYRRQLWYYMAITRADYGVLMLMPFTGLDTYYRELYTPKEVNYDEVLKEIEERGKKYIEMMTANKMPEPEKGPWCSICRYKNKCFTQPLV